tara:strand:- start:63 stop:605 length:543 start_codon:yes stop_codon:yes gene_type:complete
MFDLISYDDGGRPRLSVKIEDTTPTLVTFFAVDAVANTANPRASRGSFDVTEFNDSTNEYALYQNIMPQNYPGNGLDVRLMYTMKTATSGNVDWSIEFERAAVGDQDLDSDSFSTAIAVTDLDVPTTSGVIGLAEFSVTSGAAMDNIVAGDVFGFRVTRLATADTATGDAEILGIEIRGK